MIWVVAYLVIGMLFALRIPITQAKAKARLDALTPAQLANIPDDDRKILAMSSDTLQSSFTTQQLVLGGLLWPVQVLFVIVVELYFAFRRHRH